MIEDLARRINAVLTPLFAQIDLTLVDFKLELGLNAATRWPMRSARHRRLWIVMTDQSDRILDKDRFRKDLGGVMEAYGEVSNGSKVSVLIPLLPVVSARFWGISPGHLMTRRLTRSTVNVRSGVLGLMLGVPLAGPVLLRTPPRSAMPRILWWRR